MLSMLGYSLLFAAMMVGCFLLGWFGRLSVGRMDLKKMKPTTMGFGTQDILQDMEDEFTPKPMEHPEPFRYSDAGTVKEETGPDLKEDELKE